MSHLEQIYTALHLSMSLLKFFFCISLCPFNALPLFLDVSLCLLQFLCHLFLFYSGRLHSFLYPHQHMRFLLIIAINTPCMSVQ